MDSDQRRKRKRHVIISGRNSITSQFLSVRTLILCFSFVCFVFMLSYRYSLGFRPVLVVPRRFSSHPIRLYSSNSILSRSQLRIEDRVLFPDHLLLIVKSNRNLLGEEFDCVYSRDDLENNGISSIIRRNILSIDEYNEFESIVRCPLPPLNYSAAVNLGFKARKYTDTYEKLGSNRNRNWTMVHSWDALAYTAILDGNTTVVFVKGLNLRPDRESDPNQFSCHFGLGNLDKNDKYVIKTKAITAAQEVVRCMLPHSIRMNPEKAQGIRVTIGIDHHRRAHDRALVPSVARIYGSKTKDREKRRISTYEKHELCVCTMVWNQASALREWIMYHSWLGVEKWFVYDNNSDDGLENVINELELNSYNVSRHVWPWIKSQEAGFSHCALRARGECNWVGFFDVDEYFYFPLNQGQDSLKSLVSNYTYTNIAEIRTGCHSFGPSGLSSTPSKGVMIGYTCRLQSPERHKSIVKPEALELSLLNVVHHFRTRKRFRYLNLPQSTAVINHYKYQVWESFRAKFYRRVATYVVDWRENQNEGSRDRAPGLGTEAIEPRDWRLRFCEVWDTGLRDFVLAYLSDPVSGLVPWEKASL